MRPATTETIHKEAIKAIEDRIRALENARNQYRSQAKEHTEIAMAATREAIATDEKIGVMRHTIRCLEGEFKAHEPMTIVEADRPE